MQVEEIPPPEARGTEGERAEWERHDPTVGGGKKKKERRTGGRVDERRVPGQRVQAHAWKEEREIGWRRERKGWKRAIDRMQTWTDGWTTTTKRTPRTKEEKKKP